VQAVEVGSLRQAVTVSRESEREEQVEVEQPPLPPPPTDCGRVVAELKGA
jgi:hypothetical protein